jgi:hydrogenase nickel insertion protein HypA
MNEKSLLKTALQQVEDLASGHPDSRVIAIRLRIGERARVQPDLLKNAFVALVQGTPFHGARLSLERAPPEATCGQCGNKFRLDRSHLACEKCGSLRLKVEDIEEVYVDLIKFKDGTMSTNSLIQTLRGIEFMRDFPPRFVDEIAKISKLRNFRKNETLFDENQFADKLYLISSGNVLLEVCTAETGCKPILTVEAGEMLGWSSLTDERKYTARAVATEPVEVIQIDGNQMRAICDSDPRFGYEFLRRAMTALAKRLSVTWKQLGNVYLSHYLPFGVIPAAEND